MTNTRWMKLKEASAYARICKDRLPELVREGRIVGFKDPDNERGDWIFDRESIDAYRLAQSRPHDLEAKALEVIAKWNLKGANITPRKLSGSIR
jgi:hypothetical protein